LEQLRQLVAAARARLAELFHEGEIARGCHAGGVVPAIALAPWNKAFQRRTFTSFQRESNWTRRGERLDSTGRALSAARSRCAGLIVDYRRKFLDSLVRGGEEEAKQAETHYEQAKAQSDKDYEETAAAVADKKQLTAEEEAELSRLWKKLVKLYHPDRFANQPDKLETYHKLTAAINRAKDAGDIKTLREIAEYPHGFILRQGWARPVR